MIPEPARPIIAAHLAYRRVQGAQDTDPYFVHREVPGRAPTAVLRIAAQRACQRLHLNPPWLHRDPCRYGADIGLTPRTRGWLVERGLSLARPRALSGAVLSRVRIWGRVSVGEVAVGGGRVFTRPCWRRSQTFAPPRQH